MCGGGGGDGGGGGRGSIKKNSVRTSEHDTLFISVVLL